MKKIATIKHLSIVAALCLAPAAYSADDVNKAEMLAKAREIPKIMVPKLLQVLTSEIDRTGHAGAIGVCRDKAPKMAAALGAKTGWDIRRVSSKNRNPKAVPDAWEAGVLAEFENRLAAGEDPTAIDKGAVVEVDGQRMYRYMKALPTQHLCLNCHGGVDMLAPGVYGKLKDLYPDDKATGYGLKQLRGAITIKRPL